MRKSRYILVENMLFMKKRVDGYIRNILHELTKKNAYTLQFANTIHLLDMYMYLEYMFIP